MLSILKIFKKRTAVIVLVPKLSGYKNSVNHECFVDALADNVPENISFLCGVFGAIIQNHCLQMNKLSDDVEISSIRFLLEERGMEYNCPLGLIGEPAPPPPHRYSRSKNVLKRHIRCSALGKLTRNNIVSRLFAIQNSNGKIRFFVYVCTLF